MLKVAYIAGDEPEAPKPAAVKAAARKKDMAEAILEIRYSFFKKAVKKQEARIKAIQEYIPGWAPTFKTN